MPTTTRHDVASHYGGWLVLTIANIDPPFKIQGYVYVFDIVEKKQVCEFPVRHKGPGYGTRLALSHDEKMCFVGCYDAYGIAGYAIPDGKEVWRRKDLKSVQSVQALAAYDLVFCGRETGAAHLLHARTGETAEKLNGVKDIYGSPFDKSVIVDGRSLEFHRPFGVKKATIKRAGRVLRQCSFSRTEVIVSESGALRCFDLESQELLWTHIVPEGANYVRFQSLPDQQCFVSVNAKGNPNSTIDYLAARKWNIVRAVRLPDEGYAEFCLNGTALFRGNLCLFSAETGQQLHDFTTEAILKRDPRYQHELLVSLVQKFSAPQELEKYMKSEGFAAERIRKALFLLTTPNKGRGG